MKRGVAGAAAPGGRQDVHGSGMRPTSETGAIHVRPAAPRDALSAGHPRAGVLEPLLLESPGTLTAKCRIAIQKPIESTGRKATGFCKARVEKELWLRHEMSPGLMSR